MKEGKYYHRKRFPSSIPLLKSRCLIFTYLKCRNAGPMLMTEGQIARFYALYIMMKEYTSFKSCRLLLKLAQGLLSKR